MVIRYVSVNGYNEHELVRDVWQEHVQAGLWEIMQDSGNSTIAIHAN